MKREKNKCRDRKSTAWWTGGTLAALIVFSMICIWWIRYGERVSRTILESLKTWNYVELREDMFGKKVLICMYVPSTMREEIAIKHALQVGKMIEYACDPSIVDSDLWRVNHAEPGEEVRVTPFFLYLLMQAHDVWRMTSGGYSPSVGGLQKAWQERVVLEKTPTESALQNALQSGWMGQLSFVEKKSSVYRRKMDFQLNLQGIAKGYAFDEMLSILRAHGISRTAIITNDCACVGAPPPGDLAWMTPIKKHADDVYEALPLVNAAYSYTDSTWDGESLVPPVLDPRTGYPPIDGIKVYVVANMGRISQPLSVYGSVFAEDLMKVFLYSNDIAWRCAYGMEKGGQLPLQTVNFPPAALLSKNEFQFKGFNEFWQ